MLVVILSLIGTAGGAITGVVILRSMERRIDTSRLSSIALEASGSNIRTPLTSVGGKRGPQWFLPWRR
jgi:hypothetical protein